MIFWLESRVLKLLRRLPTAPEFIAVGSMFWFMVKAKEGGLASY